MSSREEILSSVVYKYMYQETTSFPGRKNGLGIRNEATCAYAMRMRSHVLRNLPPGLGWHCTYTVPEEDCETVCCRTMEEGIIRTSGQVYQYANVVLMARNAWIMSTQTCRLVITNLFTLCFTLGVLTSSC